jgi:hypothetical protein
VKFPEMAAARVARGDGVELATSADNPTMIFADVAANFPGTSHHDLSNGGEGPDSISHGILALDRTNLVRTLPNASRRPYERRARRPLRPFQRRSDNVSIS